MTGLCCSVGVGQVGSSRGFSETPTVSPRLLACCAVPLLPVCPYWSSSSGSCVIAPSLQTNGTQIWGGESVKPSKSQNWYPKGFRVEVSEPPATRPVSLSVYPEALFGPP